MGFPKQVFIAECDRCGVEERAPSEEVLPDNWRTIFVRGASGSNATNYVLCDECADDFVVFLRHFNGNEGGGVADEPEQPAPPVLTPTASEEPVATAIITDEAPIASPADKWADVEETPAPEPEPEVDRDALKEDIQNLRTQLVRMGPQVVQRQLEVVKAEGFDPLTPTKSWKAGAPRLLALRDKLQVLLDEMRPADEEAPF